MAKLNKSEKQELVYDEYKRGIETAEIAKKYHLTKRQVVAIIKKFQ